VTVPNRCSDRRRCETPSVASGGAFECAVPVGVADGFVVVDAAVQAVPQDLKPAVAEFAERSVWRISDRDIGVVELARPG